VLAVPNGEALCGQGLPKEVAPTVPCRSCLVDSMFVRWPRIKLLAGKMTGLKLRRQFRGFAVAERPVATRGPHGLSGAVLDVIDSTAEASFSIAITRVGDIGLYLPDLGTGFANEPVASVVLGTSESRRHRAANDNDSQVNGRPAHGGCSERLTDSACLELTPAGKNLVGHMRGERTRQVQRRHFVRLLCRQQSPVGGGHGKATVAARNGSIVHVAPCYFTRVARHTTVTWT
jgi:hypothetical protein